MLPLHLKARAFASASSRPRSAVSGQVPAGIVFNVGRRRIARKLGFNGKAIQYEHA